MIVVTPGLMVGLAIAVLIGRLFGIMKGETWVLVPLLLGCAAWLSVS